MSDRPINGVEAHSGMTRTGMPLSLNRAPAADIDPWIARIVVARIDTDPSFETECGVCTDIAYQRLLLGGEWEIETADGPQRFGTEPILMGPQSRYMPVHCTGPMSTLGLGFRPGALRKLIGGDTSTLMDRIEMGDPLGLFDVGASSDFATGASVQDWADILEERMRAVIRRIDPQPPNPISTAFEHASFVDPNIATSTFAEQQGISLRTLERIVRRDFGLTPRTVLRRARALDLAAQMLDLATEEDENEFLMRFFDQSHRIREFQTFFGVTPHTFRKKERMLLTIILETRAARRLEELQRISPGEPRPWHAVAG